MPQQAAFEYLRHGQIPFFRLPMADLGRREGSAYAGAEAVILGAPFDGGTTYQPGARLGPYQVRRVSALVQSYHPEHAVDVFKSVRIVDGGNVVFPPFDPQAVRDLIQSEIGRVLDAGAVPFLVGGDHTVALPALRAVAARHGALAVVHVDAHSDTSGPEVWGDRWHHGTPLRHAIEEGLVEKGQLYQIGLRGPWGAREDDGPALAHGARVYTADDVADTGIDTLMAHIRSDVGKRPVYLTFDIDAVDPAFAPGTGTPVPGGLTSREALRLIRGLAGLRFTGMDLVEVAPSLDHADVTAHLAAHLLYEGIAALAVSRKQEPR